MTEFKTAVVKKLSEIQENSERQFSDLGDKNNEQNKYFTKEIETIKKNQTEILELRNKKRDEECVRKHWQLSRPYGRENYQA